MARSPSPTESINRLIGDLCSYHYSSDAPRRFSGYAKRLQVVLAQLPPPENGHPSVQRALEGISGVLESAVAETLSVYRNMSKIYLQFNCGFLANSLQRSAVAVAGWLRSMDSDLRDNTDLHNKMADLAADMEQSCFQVPENEDRIYTDLMTEAQRKQTRTAVKSAIIMDLARALGIDPSNHSKILQQIKLLKKDIPRCNSLAKRLALISLVRTLDDWSNELKIPTLSSDLNFEFDDPQISQFNNFLCPLTKEVMKEPVVLESSQTYERTSIEHLIQWCMENGRDPSCPVTGKVLKSLEHKPNIGLALAIEEWFNRNVEIQLKNVVRYLGEDPPPSMDCIDRALEYVYNISEYYPSNIYKVRDVDIVVLLVKLLRNHSKIIGSTHSRSKVLMALLSLSKDEESKKIMLRNGITRLAIPSLVGSSEKERECAVKLLLEFCSDDAYCIKVASEKGALVLLSGMARDTEHPSLSNLAEDLLKRIERVEDIVEDLAAAGRIEPLLSRLCNGSDDDKIKMAYMVGKMTLTNRSKEQIAKRCVTTLVELLSKPEGKTPSLRT